MRLTPVQLTDFLTSVRALRPFRKLYPLDQLLDAMHNAIDLHGLAKWFQREPNRESVELVCASLGIFFGEIYL